MYAIRNQGHAFCHAASDQKDPARGPRQGPRPAAPARTAVSTGPRGPSPRRGSAAAKAAVRGPYVDRQAEAEAAEAMSLSKSPARPWRSAGRAGAVLHLEEVPDKESTETPVSDLENESHVAGEAASAPGPPGPGHDGAAVPGKVAATKLVDLCHHANQDDGFRASRHRIDRGQGSRQGSQGLPRPSVATRRRGPATGPKRTITYCHERACRLTGLVLSSPKQTSR